WAALAPAVRWWSGDPGRERHDLFATSEEEAVGAHEERVHPLLNDFPEGQLDPARIAGVEEHELHAERARGGLHLSALGLGKDRVGRVPQVSDGLHARDQFEQELKAFPGDLGEEEVDAGEISAGTIETVDEADPHRISALHEDDRDRV